MNPFAELRQKYECRSTAGIARALVSPIRQRLWKLSVRRRAMEVIWDLSCAITSSGCAAWVITTGMRASFFDSTDSSRRGRTPSAEPLSKQIREHAAAAGSPALKLRRLRLGNIVARALTRNGIATPSIVPDRLLLRDVARKRCRPFIYSHEQIELLLKTARAYPGRRAPLRPLTLYTMLVVAYCAGLRLGEIAGLELRDIDLQAGTIDVRDTKFFKSRRLPLSPSAVTALRNYLVARRKAGASQEAQAPLFVHEKGGYSQITAGALLKNVIRRAGLNTGRGRGGPRIHDIRHTFVVHRMTEWYREGINPQNRLQYLATYLGHLNIHSTLIYLTITQELLQHANARFRGAEASVLKAIQGGSRK